MLERCFECLNLIAFSEFCGNLDNPEREEPLCKKSRALTTFLLPMTKKC